MQVQRVYVKTRAEFGKQCIFDDSGRTAEGDVKPNPDLMNHFIMRTRCHVGVQHSTRLALHEVQLVGPTLKNTGMFHTEGGWPKEINPKDEEATARFRRRVEKDDNWAPKLRNLFSIMENSILQNNAIDIYGHYFNDMIPTRMLRPLGIRTVNIFSDRRNSRRPVNNISWSPDCGRRIAVSYYSPDLDKNENYSNDVYIWELDNSNTPYLTLEPFSPSLVTEYNPRDPSVLCSGLMSGQVCSWDTRVGTRPIQSSHPQFSHRGYTNAVKWLPTKSNCEFLSVSTDGCGMWWDTRNLRQPTEVLIFDLEQPNVPSIDRAIGASCLNFGPTVGSKFMFGLEDGTVIAGSRKGRNQAEKVSLRFEAHSGPVLSVDRNVFNPAVFLTIGDWSARIWAEDTREGCFASTKLLAETPTGGCWNKARLSVFFVISATGLLTAWDLLHGLDTPVLSIQLCPEQLTAIAPQEDGIMMAIGNSAGKVFLVETTDSLQAFDKKERAALSDYFERCSKFTKTADMRLKEMRLMDERISKGDLLPIATGRKHSRAKAAKRGSKKLSISDKTDKTGQLSGISKRRSLRSLPKDRRRLREEFPDIAHAEDQFYDIVTQERERLQQAGMLEARKTGDPLTVSKRQVVRKGDKKSTDSEKQEKEKRGKGRQAQSVLERKKRLKSRLRRDPSEMFIETRKQRIDTTRSMEPLLSGSIDLEAEEKKSRKKSRKIIRVCKPYICKPEVCCRKMETLGRTRSQGHAKDVSRSKERKKSKQAHFEDTIERTKAGRESIATTDDHATQATGGKFSAKRTYRILRKMLKPPNILTTEVERAKQEIRQQSMRKKRGGRYITRRISGSSLQRGRGKVRGHSSSVPQTKKKQQKQQSEEREDGSKVQLQISRAGRAKEDGEKRRAASRDRRTSPRDTSTSRKVFESLLGGPFPESIEDKSTVGKDYLDQLDPRTSGLYPRISDVHFAESR